MRTRAALIGVWLLAIGSLVQAAAGGPDTYARFRRASDNAFRRYTVYDRDGDGQPEIRSLKRLGSRRGGGQGSVLVLIEERLTRTSASDRPLDLMPAVRTYLEDLGRQGLNAVLASVRLYDGPQHQDGLIVLALRDVLRSIYERAPDLRAAMLIGDFPTPFLVRQYYWPREDGLTLFAGTSREKAWKAVRHVRSIAEPVASPSDIVLADLDGNWDLAYRRDPERLGGLLAAFPDDPNRELTDTYERTAEQFEDFFFVQDGMWTEASAPGGKRRFTFSGEFNAECTAADRQQVNVLARPEISIGRINARHAGVEPNPSIKDTAGRGLLDDAGRPQALEFADEKDVPGQEALWVRSEQLERRLLQEYFRRNHAYRLTRDVSSFRPASITTEWDSSVPDMKAAVAGWKDENASDLDLKDLHLTALDFATWMSRPALARAIKGHSGPTGFGFDPPASVEAYTAAVGGAPWWWTKDGRRLVPSLGPLKGWINYGVIRAMYENGKLSGVPALYFHTGCEAMTPAHYEREPYTSPRHGVWQIAESLLMFGDGLALVGRGKVFYDEPREFWAVMGRGGSFGDAWRRYFDVEGADAELAKDGIGRKRAYFWSVIGDCTLQLPVELVRPGSGPADQP